MKLLDYIITLSFSGKKQQAIYNLLERLIEFEQQKGRSYLLSDFGYQEIQDFVHFMQNHENKYRPNTVKHYTQRLRYILNKASKNHKVDDSYSDMKVRGECPMSVYLTMDEIGRLAKLHCLDVGQERVRDYFVIMCLTGLRISDARRLTPANFQNDVVIIKTKKTGALVHIPIHPLVREILQRWGNNMPRCYTAFGMRKHLQTLCEYAGIMHPVTFQRTEGAMVVTITKSKCEMVTPHTARRSFATNLYLMSQQENTPIYRIMLLTGHTTEQSFFKYIKIEKTENAAVLSRHPFFR